MTTTFVLARHSVPDALLLVAVLVTTLIIDRVPKTVVVGPHIDRRLKFTFS